MNTPIYRYTDCSRINKGVPQRFLTKFLRVRLQGIYILMYLCMYVRMFLCMHSLFLYIDKYIHIFIHTFEYMMNENIVFFYRCVWVRQGGCTGAQTTNLRPKEQHHGRQENDERHREVCVHHNYIWRNVFVTFVQLSIYLSKYLYYYILLDLAHHNR